jgi:hypothetical protein
MNADQVLGKMTWIHGEAGYQHDDFLEDEFSVIESDRRLSALIGVAVQP